MFTGIVSDVGQVRHVERRGDTHVVLSTKYDVSAIEIGASIACAGVCMTVIDKGGSTDRWFAVTASGETLSRTTIGTWKVGHAVNLERPLRVGDELGGHIMTGHVDGVADIVEAAAQGESMRMTLQAPLALSRFVATKGSIGLDGVSLTVNEVEGTRLSVNLIPHTLGVTTFGQARPGDRVNLEIDVLARYVARLVKG
jgi:riboflavin synthase